MSAAEKLKALRPDDLPLTAEAELRHLFPQIVAVVEAAERHEAKKLLPNNGTLWALEAALSALDEALP